MKEYNYVINTPVENLTMQNLSSQFMNHEDSANSSMFFLVFLFKTQIMVESWECSYTVIASTEHKFLH